jgi:hypothetical protein
MPGATSTSVSHPYERHPPIYHLYCPLLTF